MANGSKVFVSPGVYTSEKDLSFVAQSVGVTTLGMVGEALKGPAFEPIFISSYDEYIKRFGGTSPQTYVDSQIPKYEMGYISKAYLSQANQLFVTRVLGLSGYDAGKSWSVQTIGAIDKTTVASAVTQTITVPYFIGADQRHMLAAAAATIMPTDLSGVTGTTIYKEETLTNAMDPYHLLPYSGSGLSVLHAVNLSSGTYTTASGTIPNLYDAVYAWVLSFRIVKLITLMRSLLVLLLVCMNDMWSKCF